LNSIPCIVVASITPATPPPCGKSIKQQLQIQLRSSCLRCSAGAADADVGQAAHTRLRHSALPPHVQAVYTLQNSDLHSVSKVRCKLACMQAISLASISRSTAAHHVHNDWGRQPGHNPWPADRVMFAPNVAAALCLMSLALTHANVNCSCKHPLLILTDLVLRGVEAHTVFSSSPPFLGLALRCICVS
jgi:hypothetical protein